MEVEWQRDGIGRILQTREKEGGSEVLKMGQDLEFIS